MDSERESVECGERGGKREMYRSESDQPDLYPISSNFFNTISSTCCISPSPFKLILDSVVESFNPSLLRS